jgi:hypothetical protein
MKRPVTTTVVASLLLAATFALAWWFWPTRTPPLDAPTVDLVKFVASEEFETLSDDRKLAYVQTLMDKGLPALALAAAEAKLTDAQRERGIDNATQAGIKVRMGKHLDTWLKLDEKGKRDYIRKLVRDNPTRPPGPGDRPGSRGGGRMTASQLKRFIENSPPTQRAAMAEFMAALKKEREALGVAR